MNEGDYKKWMSVLEHATQTMATHLGEGEHSLRKAHDAIVGVNEAIKHLREHAESQDDNGECLKSIRYAYEHFAGWDKIISQFIGLSERMEALHANHRSA
jgi:hypothetical protein